MTQDELLKYYNEELEYIRELGSEFAKAHPKVAGRLKLDAKSVDDPHVARLIESFALLNAKIRHRLEDDMPELRDTLIHNICPHYLSPIPSMSIVQFKPLIEQLKSRIDLPKNISLKTDSEYGAICEFMTCYPISLLPLEVRAAEFSGQPFQAPALSIAERAKSVLRLSLGCLNNANFTELNLDKLRFFINAPLQQAYLLHELLSNHTLAIAICSTEDDGTPHILNKRHIQPVGFDKEEGLLPYDARTFLGYRLLTEFFSFPQKFLFFDLLGLNQAKQKLLTSNQNIEIYFYFNRSLSGLEQKIDASYFALGCTPIVNLFEKTAKPFHLDHKKSEYHIIPDESRSFEVTEVYNIRNVSAINIAEGKVKDYHPYYGMTHHLDPDKTAYWHVSYKPSWYANKYIQQGSGVFMSFVDPDFDAHATDVWTIKVDLLCTNRDLARKLPFGEAMSGLIPVVSDKVIATVKCLQPFTPAYRPVFSDNLGWQLISHFSLNHLSLTDDEEGLLALKEILKLYDFSKSDIHRNLRDGILNIRCRQKTVRNPTRYGNVFLQGVEINLVVDETNFTGSSLFLFASVFDYFLTLFCNINSFTELVISNIHRAVLYNFSPKIGSKPLL